MDEENNKKKVTIITSVLLLVTVVIGVSYAYFSARSTSQTKTITTGQLSLTFDDATPILNATNIQPIVREDILSKAVKKQFTITNTSSEKVFVDISLVDMNLPENLKRYDFMWALYEENTNISNGSFSGGYINEDNEVKIGEYQVFEKNEDKTYNLYIWIEETGLEQNDMMNQTFSAKIETNAIAYYTSQESDFTFDSTTGTITDYLGTDTDIVIPSEMYGVEVSTIGFEAFYNNKLTSVVIPDSVTTIEDLAFDTNSLTKVVIPNCVTSLGASAFGFNKLVNIIIPNSVTYFGSDLFQSNQLTSVVIPDSVTSIKTSAFTSNKLTNVVIPNSITSIGDAAFSNNNLTNVVIPSSVTTIGNSAFDNPNLEEIVVLGKSNASEFTSLGTNWNGSCTNIIYQ